MPVSRSCVFFTHFCFELAFGVNIEVVDNWVSFLMDLEWLENVFWILSYDKKHFKCVLGKPSSVSHSCVLFTRFCFELASGVHIEVVDNWVIFLMALEWLENVLWNLSYDKNTPSVFWENHPLFRILVSFSPVSVLNWLLGVNMEVVDNWVSFQVALVWLENIS